MKRHNLHRLCRPSSFLPLATLAFAFALAPSAALAGPRDFVIYVPGMGGTQQQAKPFIDTFFRELEKGAGWPSGSADGAYLEDPKLALDYIQQKKPGFGMMSVAMYLDLACRKEGAEPIATIVGDAMPSGKYHVVVKEGGPTDLKGLEGKRLASNHLQNPRFVSRVVFADQIDVEKHFKLQPTPSPLKPLKQVDRGEADAALVDDAQLANLKALPFGKTLRVVYSSETLPPLPVVAFTSVVKPAERAEMRKIVLGICGTASGAPVCKSIQVTRFAPIDAAAYKAALTKYCR